jgi:lysophospholipase L1-like esterase
MRYLALGDSYTIGEGVEPVERWPVILAGLLRAEGIRMADPDIIATTGWTTGELMAGIRNAASVGPYDLVSLLIGVNDHYRGHLPAEFDAGFRGLLQVAAALAANRPRRVLVLSIPDWSATPFAKEHGREKIGPELDRFNALARAAAAEAGACWVDITLLSRADPTALAADGLHVNGAMYRRWAEAALPVVRRELVVGGRL